MSRLLSILTRLLVALLTWAGLSTSFGGERHLSSSQGSYLDRGWLNGIPYQVKQIADPRDPERLIDDYRRLWEADLRTSVRRQRVGPWILLSRLTPDAIETLQVIGHPNGSNAYLTRWTSSASAPSEASAPVELLPPCSRVIAHMLSDDGDRGFPSTTTVQSCLSLGDAEKSIRILLEKAGYHEDVERSFPGLIRAQRGIRTIIATLSSAPHGVNLVYYRSEAGR